MTLDHYNSSEKNFISRNVVKLVRKIVISSPSFEQLKGIGKIFKLNKYSSWTEIDQSLKLYRFTSVVPENDFEYDYNNLSDFERFRPILLIHGYQSNHISWNWMALNLWEDGFRQIYAFELDDYRKGFDHNMHQLIQVTNYLLKIQLIHKKFDIIAHSMGGLVTRQYLKLYQGAKHIRLFVSLGTPYKGVFKFWSILANLDDAKESANDFVNKEKLELMNESQYEESLYLLTQVNVIGAMKRYLGTDGLFKNYPLNDMINFYVGTTHFNLNKTEKTYSIIKNIFLKQSWFYKIRLLSIHKTNIIQEGDNRVFDLKLSLRFIFKLKANNNFITNYYPTIDRDELYFSISEPFIPESPVISYCDMGVPNQSKYLMIGIIYENKVISEKDLIITHCKNNEENIDYISLNATISSIKIDLNINFAINKYLLN